MDIVAVLAEELGVSRDRVGAAIALFDEGATVPFVARYRKERTGGLDETQLHLLRDRRDYLQELVARQGVILKEIEAQGKLDDALRRKIEACRQKTELEDLYLPFRPKRRTRASMAKEKGLEPLADAIAAANQTAQGRLDLNAIAATYVSDAVPTPEAALQGASDILAERIADRADLRALVRERVMASGVLRSKIKPKAAAEETKFDTYRDYQAKLTKIPAHATLAILRGERDGVLSVAIDFDRDRLLETLESQLIVSRDRPLRQFLQTVIADALDHLLAPAATAHAIATLKEEADRASVETFAANLRDLLLAAPAGMKPTLGIDPGFRTGCKVAALDATGQFQGYFAIFPHTSPKQRPEAAQKLRDAIKRYGIELIAIGNGTASRETAAFVAEALQGMANPPIAVTVSEAGASVYSASAIAVDEFPDLDVTARGAISIGRRLQDPLAELVKIDPKSIGVGQYQHDINQKLLAQKLSETVESCVNYVGVDLNTASKELLSFVSGITPTVANNIVAHRNGNGPFLDRKALLKVAKLGPKTFEQAAGFLRIRNGINPLDNTAVHPESYGIVEAIARDLNTPTAELSKQHEQLKTLNLRPYLSDRVGEPTLRDILKELEKPGRDPRAQFAYARFRDDIQTLADLKPGEILEGVITNVANFGAFVDIGVHQDGLIHISQLADRFVSDPKTVVRTGQIVRVQVLEVNEKLKRIGLSLKNVPQP